MELESPTASHAGMKCMGHKQFGSALHGEVQVGSGEQEARSGPGPGPLPSGSSHRDGGNWDFSRSQQNTLL